jgi:hypothetical protein
MSEFISVSSFSKKETVLNNPGNFLFQVSEDEEIVLGRNQQMSKKKIETIIHNIREVFKSISENISKYHAEVPYYEGIIKKLKNFVNSRCLRFPGLQVINLCKEHIEIFSRINERLLICEKSDGVRFLLLQFANGKIFFVGRNLEFYEIETDVKLSSSGKKKDWEIENFLDGELILDKHNQNVYSNNVVEIEETMYQVNFLVFDAIVIRSENIGHLRFKERLKHLSNFFFLKEAKKYFFTKFSEKMEIGTLRSIKTSTSHQSDLKFAISVYMKDYFTFDKIDYLYSTLSPKLPHENDGIIINLDDYPYYSGQSSEIYKWKPANLNTIDFEIKVETIGSNSLYLLQVQETRDRIIPVSVLFIDQQEKEDFQKLVDEISFTGKALIAECYYDFEYDSKMVRNFNSLVHDQIIKKQDEDIIHISCYNVNHNQTSNILGGWRFMRFRKDKLNPNSLYTFQNVWKNILENLQMDEIMAKVKENFKNQQDLEATINLSSYIKNSLSTENKLNNFNNLQDFSDSRDNKDNSHLQVPKILTINRSPAKDFLKKKRDNEADSLVNKQEEIKPENPKQPNINKKEVKAKKDIEKKEKNKRQQLQTLDFAFDSEKMINKGSAIKAVSNNQNEDKMSHQVKENAGFKSKISYFDDQEDLESLEDSLSDDL